MPVRVYSPSYRTVSLGFKPLPLSFRLHDSRAMLSSQMEKELLGTGGICRMAAHALSRQQCAFNYRIFIEVMDVSLIYAYLAVGLISWSKLAVGHAIIIQRILAYKEHEGTELLPLPILVSCYCNRQSIPHIGFSKPVPFTYIETGIASLDSQDVSTTVADLCKDLCILFRKVEVQRSDSRRDGHTYIIREDLREFITEHGLTAAGNQQKANCRERCQYMSHYLSFHFS